MSGGSDGALFPNKNKEKGDKRPHYTGNIVVNGVKFSLAGWKNRAKESGEPYMSLKLSEWRERGDSKPAPKQQDDFDDDIPF